MSENELGTPRVSKRILGVRIEAHPIVFPAGALLILAFVLYAVLFPDVALVSFKGLKSWISGHFAWLYILAMSGFLVFSLWLCFSKYGRIRLGPDNGRPEFGTLTWFSMLFSAGMGIGMLFFGVYEPLWHYMSPPVGEGRQLGDARRAMAIANFHWGLHAWSLYAIVALALAYFGFRRGLPLSFRSVFYPMIGKRIHGRIGDLIDIMAVLATLFGLATSLGLGAKQVNAGLNYVFGLPQETWIQVILIACITGMAVVSLVSGLHVGIRRLSEINMGIAAFLLLFLFVAGPTVYLLSSLVENVGEYLQTLPTRGFWTATYEGGDQASWFSSWTVFYWGWWIAWCPFVGMFIARVSRNRTIREFIMGTLLVPTAVAIIWLTGFGNSALHQEIYQTTAEDPAAVEATYDYAPEEVPVQVIDEQTGLPMSEDGDWFVAADAKGRADPVGVRVKPAGEDEAGNAVYETSTGDRVRYNWAGTLVNVETGSLYKPPEKAEYHGPFKSTTKPLTLGEHLTNPVLNPARDGVQDTKAIIMFVMLGAYPLAWLTSLLGTISVILFFVTSSDSASLVADIIASGGNEDPPTGTRLFWGILEGCLAAVLLLAGGLVALQTGSITLGLPFCIIVILMCFSLAHGLKREWRGLIPDWQKRHAEVGAEPGASADHDGAKVEAEPAAAQR